MKKLGYRIIDGYIDRKGRKHLRAEAFSRTKCYKAKYHLSTTSRQRRIAAQAA